MNNPHSLNQSIFARSLLLIVISGCDYPPIPPTGPTIVTQTTTVTTVGPTPSPSAPLPTSQAVPGCINGVLSDPRTYFFSVINKTEGSPASDWQSVLQRFPAPPAQGTRVSLSAPFYGLTQQIDSSGTPRGRVFLPTDTPDSSGYYVTGVDVLDISTRWTWKPLVGPPYVPRSC